MAAESGARLWTGAGLIGVEGEVGERGVAALAEALDLASQAFSGPLTLDLGGLEIADGVAMAELITALRVLLARHGRLLLSPAPQLLAHTLYRVGLLEDGRLSVGALVSEEPTTAN